jgi:hypothetical protein
VATFGANMPPAKKMFIKLNPTSTVEFEEQSN